LQEHPIKYDYLPGERVHPSLKGRMVPVPPRWARDWRTGSARYQYATLSKELEHWFPEHVRSMCVDYVKNWPYNREMGIDLVITGNVAQTKQTWLAEAVVNELILRYAARSDFSANWFNVRKAIPWIIDARSGKGEYTPIRNRILNTRLLFVDGLMSMRDHPEGKWFLEWVYRHRYDEQLPTITTIQWTNVRRDGWDQVEQVFGTELMTRLHDNAQGNIATWETVKE
jgi:DNA replication protein DnaC